MTIETVIARVIANGNEKADKFSGAPKDGSFAGIPDGTVFIIPTDYVVYKNKKFQDAEFTIVKNESTDDGYEFYPSSCGKQFFCVNPDGSKKLNAEGHQDVLMPTGSFATGYRAAKSVAEFMDSMIGRRVKVTYPADSEVTILKYGTADTKKVKVPCYELV